MHSVWWGKLNERINEKLLASVEHVAGGGARAGSNPASTGENYMEQVGYIRGLREAREMAGDVDDEMMGISRNGPSDTNKNG